MIWNTLYMYINVGDDISYATYKINIFLHFSNCVGWYLFVIIEVNPLYFNKYRHSY